jgi:LysM repeat protein
LNIDALFQALQPFGDPGLGTFRMSLAQVDAQWTDIRALLDGALAGQTLSITGITAFPSGPSGGVITYRGQATLFPWIGTGQATLAVTVWWSVDATGAPQVLLQVVVPEGWSLSSSLMGLGGTDAAAVKWDEGAFLVTSTTTTSTSYPDRVLPWINFSGTVSTAGPFANTGSLLAPPARQVAGHIDLLQGTMPVINLQPTLLRTADVGVALEVGAQVTTLYKHFPASGIDPIEVPPWPIAQAAIRASVRLGSGTAIPLIMLLTDEGDNLPMTLDGGPVPLTGLNELLSLAGNADLNVLPAAVPTPAGFELRGLSMSVDLGDGSENPARASISFDVALRTGGWAVLPNDILTLDSLGIGLRVDFDLNSGLDVSAMLYGTMTLVEVMHLYASVSIPGLAVAVSLDEGTTVSVADLMEQFMVKLTGRAYRPPVDMELKRLEIAAMLPTGEYGVSADIITPWNVSFGSYNGGALISLGIDSVSLEIDYDGSVLSGFISAITHINSVQFYLGASTVGGPDAGWDFAAGLASGSRIQILALMQSFMFPNATSSDAPGEGYGVPTLDITTLDLRLSTDASNTPYRFSIRGVVQGSWNFSLFGAATNFTLFASISLTGTRPRVGGYIQIDAEWAISGSISGRFTLFGLLITATYKFDATNTALTFGIWYGNRGLEATVTRSLVTEKDQKVTRTVLTVRLGDLSLGDVLEFFVSLALPGESRRLPSPWDVLYQINFRDLSLTVDLDTYDIGVDYALELNLGFATLQSVGFLYTSAGGESQVLLRLKGDFLGQPYGTSPGSEPLQWDVINEPAPAIPGKGSGLIDIRYVGMGQHVALPVPDSRLKTVDDVITALKAAMGPTAGGGNPLNSPNAVGLRYDANSRWLFGLDATVLETLSLAAVFYDPHLYGARIELSGERAGSLAGLRFELVYRRITAEIGEFSIDLRIPDQFRNWEFGEVSITLGLIHLDIYTNGNFRVDAGFPANRDFSVSFTVQVFPFIGQGGFYFAALTGATSERVPVIMNGSFDPVIEAGVGLAVGVGKQFQKGPLSAGLSLEVFGIFEGIYAPFHPYDAKVPQGTYYWFQGTAGIVGKLYGAVDFKIIKASVIIVARAQATITLEAHRRAYVELLLEVTASASVEILFITVHFSFDLTLDASFTLGADSATPWIVAPPLTPVRRAQANTVQPMLRGLGAPSPRPLRQQRSQARRPTPKQLAAAHAPRAAASVTTAHAPRAAAAVTTAHAPLNAATVTTTRAPLAAAAHARDTPPAWQPVALYGAGTPKTARLQFVPAFTVADPATLSPLSAGGTPGTNEIIIVPLLVAEAAIDTGARTAAEVARISTAQLHQRNYTGGSVFSAIVETFQRWAVLEGAGAQGQQIVYADQLAGLVDLLTNPTFVTETFSYENLSSFLTASLNLEILNCPSGTTPPSPTSGTFFAMVPGITVAVTVGTANPVTRDYTVVSPASPKYATNLAAYFAQLATRYSASMAADPMASPAAESVVLEDKDSPTTDPSMAELVFGEYFALLTQAALQASVDLMAAYEYPYPTTNGPSLVTMVTQFPTDTVVVGVARGQTLHGVAASAGVSPTLLDSAYPNGLDEEQSTVEIPSGVTALSIAQDNQDASLAAFSFAASGMTYQVRAAQTLSDIAAAIPQQVAQASGPIPAPLSGATIGEQNDTLLGLLRLGATLTIPTFTYVRLPAGEADEFLAAFFQVRNQGSTGIANVDWYAQAIATLNPTPVNWLGWGTTTLTIPSAFQNSTSTSTYTVHQGDNLARVAATLALYQAGPAGTPVTGTYTVSQLSHVVTSTDTFSSLTIDFPGLTKSALITANVAADVLTPLRAIALPSFGVAVISGQTLAEVAQLFDLTLEDLVLLVEGTPAIFTPTISTKPIVPPLVVRGVPGMKVDDLVTAIAGGSPANQIAAQVSRFLLYGIRVPLPNDTIFTNLSPEQVEAGDYHGSLYGLFDVAGMLFPWTDLTVSAQVTLSTDATWITLLNSAVDEGDPSNSVRPVVATIETQSISVTVNDAAPWASWLPSTTLELDSTAAVMPLADTAPRQYGLPSTIHWQAAASPSLDESNTDSGAPGEPSIWLFPDSLHTVAAGAGTGATPAFALRSRSLDAPPAMEGAALAEWAWAVQVRFTVHRVHAPPAPDATPGTGLTTAFLPTTYVVDGADQAGEDLLFALWTYLQTRAATEGNSKLYLLYPPNATDDSPRGLRSDAQPANAIYLLKTNLSTETREPPLLRAAADADSGDAAAADDPPPEIFSAGLETPLAFVTYLWEATSVQAGGFYLNYGLNDAGLPDFVFDASGRATLTLLCLLESQIGVTPGRGLVAVNNCAVVLDNVDAAATRIYAVQTGGTPVLDTHATVPPGNVGFTISRTSPQPQPGTPASAAQITDMLYNLFGFAVQEGGGFSMSNEGLPVSPQPPPQGGTSWYYTHVIETSRLAEDAGRIAQSCSALPSPNDDPYAGVSPSSGVTVAFTAHDAFGNCAVATDAPATLPLPARYTDQLIGVGGWPGTTVSYSVQPGTEGLPPSLVLSLALQAVNYLPAPGLETSVALQGASAHALRWQRAFYQTARPGVEFAATTTLAPASTTMPLPLSGARFLSFASAGYVFTSQLAALPPLRYVTNTGDTLATIAAVYSVTAADLLVANRTMDVGAMFAAPVVVPVFDRVMQRETINAFATRTGTIPATLLSSYGNGAAPILGGVTVVVAAQAIPADDSLSLDDMAKAAGCAASDIAMASALATGLITDGIQLTVRVAVVVTSSSTFTSLVADFATSGVTTTPAEIGSANARVVGIFNGSTPSAPVNYTVDRWITPAATTLDELVAARFASLADFLTKNGDTPAVIVQNTPLQTTVTTQTAPHGVSVRAYVERTLAISIPQFGVANSVAGGSGSPAIPTLTAGQELVLPALLSPAPLSAVAFAFDSAQSLNVVATLFGTDAQTLGASIQNIGGVFVPKQPVAVGNSNTVTTDGEDSIASLLAKFTQSPPSLAALITAIAPSTTLMRQGAVIICPAPSVPSSALTLSALATAFGFDSSDVTALGRCNAALDGFLDSKQSVSYGGEVTQVGAHGTLTSLYRRAVPPASDVDFDTFLTAIAGQTLLTAGAKVILSPPPVAIEADLPVTPAVTTTITELQTAVTVSRPANEIDSSFDAKSVVATGTTPVAALTSGSPATYIAFARGVQAAYGGQLRVGAGKRSRAVGPGQQQLYVVRFAASGSSPTVNAIRSIGIDNTPTFYALPPLCRELVSRTAGVRIYQSGSDDPLGGPTQTLAFRGVDVQSWARALLVSLDLVLSAPYVATAFALTRGADGTSADFDKLVAAKKTLAEKIAGQLASILPAASTADATSAQDSLQQVLDVSLATGWDTAAVIQLPTEVSATFAATGADAGSHRFAGKPLPRALALDGTSTLGGVAVDYQVDVRAIARVLGGTPNLLKPGVTLQVSSSGPTWTIGAHDTLQYGAGVLGIGLDTLATSFSTTSPLFRDGTSVTLNGYSATVAAGDSLERVSDMLATGVAFLAVANQTVPNLLTGTVWVNGVAYPVTGSTSTLAGMATAADVSVDELAVWIAGQGVLTAGTPLHVAALLPEYSLSASKIQLDDADANLNVLLQLADPARYRRVLLELGFPLTGLEYAIERAPLTDDYETSDWLQFVTPLTDADQPAELNVTIGQLDVPVPLRAYPAPPRLVGQYATPVYPDLPRNLPLATTLADAKAWTYTTTFETLQAAQDVVWLKVGFNFAPTAHALPEGLVDDPFAALAEFSSNSVAVQADLANLLLPLAVLRANEEKRNKAKSAFMATSIMAARIAGAWGPIAPDAESAQADNSLAPQLELTFTIETRTRPSATGAPLIDSLVLTREGTASVWGPGNVQPRLGYVDAAGSLVILEPQTITGAPNELLYLIPSMVQLAAFEQRVFAIIYPGLDAVATQNARTAIWITRNERLVPGQETSAAFVYRTPETRFAALAAPALVVDEPIRIGSGDVNGLTAALLTLFTDLLGTPPTAAPTQEKLVVRYGYRLVPPGANTDGIVILSPIVFRPLFPYDDGVPAAITAAVQAWIEGSSPPSGGSKLISLEITVFSDLISGNQQPLVDLTRLDYLIMPGSSSRGTVSY